MKKLISFFIVSIAICLASYGFANNHEECSSCANNEASVTDQSRPPCRYCNGHGYYECNMCGGSAYRECGACNGTGEYVNRDGSKSKCYQCKGTGKVKCHYCDNHGRRVCKACNGTGKTRYVGE